MDAELITVSIDGYTTLCIATGVLFGALATGFIVFVAKESKR